MLKPFFQALSGSDAGLIPDDSPPKRATHASQKLKRLSKMLKDKIPTKMKDTATSIAHNTKIGKKASPKASKKNSKDEKQVLSIFLLNPVLMMMTRDENCGENDSPMKIFIFSIYEFMSNG